MGNAKLRDIDVGLAPNPNGNPPLIFTIDKTKLTFNNNNHPGFIVNFNISDPQNTGYKFPDGLADAMWVQPIAAVGPNVCPTTPMYWDGFEATNVTNNNMTLVVSDPNQAAQMFAFTLRFTQTPQVANPPCVPFDPIGDNKNGSSTKSSAALFATVAAVAVVALAAYQLLKR